MLGGTPESFLLGMKRFKMRWRSSLQTSCDLTRLRNGMKRVFCSKSLRSSRFLFHDVLRRGQESLLEPGSGSPASLTWAIDCSP